MPSSYNTQTQSLSGYAEQVALPDGVVGVFSTLSATGNATIAGNLTVTGTLTASSTEAIAGATTITAASANALAVGPAGATNPTLQVATNTASAATGLKLTSAAAAAGLAVAVISSGTDENLTVDAKGAGTVTVNGTATGGITLGRAVTLSSTINKLTLTAPASAATLTIINGTTITGPAVTGTLALINPSPQAGGSTLSVTAAMSGKPILLDTAAGTTATLPAATGTGNKYRFIVSVSATSNAHKILTVGTDYIIGNAYGYTGSTAKVFGSPAATNRSIQMPFAGTQPSGGIIGDVFEFVDIGAALWHCEGFYQAGTTPTTPYSNATS